jgi:hypothetical protein
MEIMKRSLKVNNSKERAILSDTLPYETPITFSNRFFYDFLHEYKITIEDNKASWVSNSNALDNLICIFLGVDVTNINKSNSVRNTPYSSHNFVTIPFSYGIRHKEKSFRKLSVIHPRNQLDVANFYSKYKELIIYNSSISNFSLRAPARVATTRFYDDEKKSASVILSNGMDCNNDKQYKNLKSFFGYKKLSNIHQFFESNDYHKCEQKYNHMSQLDISKCFDSIYTHSIAWAVLGKSNVKYSMAISGGQDVLSNTFADDFDRLLRTQNYNETNGILIGPELSRIFAEIIIQRIDLNLEEALEKKGLRLNHDYNIYRYVDDYFIFYNKKSTYKEIFTALELLLSEYKLSLNTEKEIIYNKPIITETTIAKRKISKLLNEKIKLELIESESIDDTQEVTLTAKINIASKPLITDFKMIISESGAEYKSVINYTLTIIESQIKVIFTKYDKATYNRKSYNYLLSSIHACIEFCFFIYTVAPRVNTTIKLSRVLKVIIDFCRSKSIEYNDMHQVFTLISENINFVIEKYDSKDYTQVETLYLLTVMSELGKDYWLEESLLIEYFGGVRNKDSGGVPYFESSLNYFSLMAIIFYTTNKVRYKKIRRALKVTIINKISLKKSTLRNDTESLLLLLDCLACPYLNRFFKMYLLKLYGIKSPVLRKQIIELDNLWFTKWNNFEFGKELDAKQSDNVY